MIQPWKTGNQPGDLFEYQFPDLPQGIQEPETVF
jgi:hypothetical protein